MKAKIRFSDISSGKRVFRSRVVSIDEDPNLSYQDFLRRVSGIFRHGFIDSETSRVISPGAVYSIEPLNLRIRERLTERKEDTNL